jgi:hypothetical protein
VLAFGGISVLARFRVDVPLPGSGLGGPAARPSGDEKGPGGPDRAACLHAMARAADDKETVLTLADVMGSAHKGVAESMAASLPPAPRCPL